MAQDSKIFLLQSITMWFMNIFLRCLTPLGCLKQIMFSIKIKQGNKKFLENRIIYRASVVQWVCFASFYLVYNFILFINAEEKVSLYLFEHVKTKAYLVELNIIELYLQFVS